MCKEWPRRPAAVVMHGSNSSDSSWLGRCDLSPSQCVLTALASLLWASSALVIKHSCMPHPYKHLLLLLRRDLLQLPAAGPQAGALPLWQECGPCAHTQVHALRQAGVQRLVTRRLVQVRWGAHSTARHSVTP
jgi:hypothetical protein